MKQHEQITKRNKRDVVGIFFFKFLNKSTYNFVLIRVETIDNKKSEKQNLDVIPIKHNAMQIHKSIESGLEVHHVP